MQFELCSQIQHIVFTYAKNLHQIQLHLWTKNVLNDFAQYLQIIPTLLHGRL